MPIEESVVRHVATLARLDLSDAELRAMCGTLSAILDHIATLRELDLTGAEPLAHAGDFPNPLREDEPRDPLGAARALDAAPARDAGFFIVPPVIE